MLAQELKDYKPNNDTESQNFLSWKGLTRIMYRKTRSSQAFRSAATSRKRIQRRKRVKDMKSRRSEQGHPFCKPGTQSSSSALDVHLRYIPACKDVKLRYILRERKGWTPGAPHVLQSEEKTRVQQIPCPGLYAQSSSQTGTSTEQHPGRETMNEPKPQQLLALTNGPTIKKFQ